jgi:outer membrane lipoprotein carrier protein
VSEAAWYRCKMVGLGRSVAVALLASTVIGGRAATPTAAELAAALQRRYDGIKDFSADFVHNYEGGVLRKQTTERGRLLIKKPGRMRWEYAAPEQKLFVSDGVKMYSYIPADKQVIVSTVPREDDAATPALFISGKGSLTRDFTSTLVDLPPGMPAGSQALKLVPRTRQQDYDWLILVVDPVSLGFRGLVTIDGQGGKSSFFFTNLKENVGLTDKDFTFRIPRGVDVVSAPNAH